MDFAVHLSGWDLRESREVVFMISNRFSIITFKFAFFLTVASLCSGIPGTAYPETCDLDNPAIPVTIQKTILQNYEQALIISDSLAAAMPDNPLGYVLKSTVLASRSMDFEDDLDFDSLSVACDSVKSRCERYYESVEENAARCLYLGLCEMYRGMIDNYYGKTLAAARHLLKAGDYFEDGLEIDSTCYDLNYGLGSYEYYISEGAGWLRTLGIIPDNREKAIEFLKIAAEKGTLTNIASLNSIAWFHMKQGNIEEALTIAQYLIEKYPHSRGMLWIYGKCLMKVERWEYAYPVFERLLVSVRSEERNNHYNEVSALFYLAQISYEISDTTGFYEYYHQINNLNLSENVRDRKENDLKQLEQFHDNIDSSDKSDHTCPE